MTADILKYLRRWTCARALQTAGTKADADNLVFGQIQPSKVTA